MFSGAGLGEISAVAGFHLRGVVEGHAVLGLVDLAFAAEAGEEAADGLAGQAGHAAEVFVGEGHEEGEGEAGKFGGIVEVVDAGEVEEGAGELAGGGGVQGEAAGGENGAVVFACEGMGDDSADVRVEGHEVEEVRAGDGLDEAGFEGLCGGAAGLVLDEGSEAEEVAGASDAKEEAAAFGGGGADLDAARANDQQVVGGKAFPDEDVMGIVTAVGADGLEVAENGGGKRNRGLRRNGGRGCDGDWENGVPPGSSAEE